MASDGILIFKYVGRQNGNLMGLAAGLKILLHSYLLIVYVSSSSSSPFLTSVLSANELGTRGSFAFYEYFCLYVISNAKGYIHIKNT